MFWGSIMSTFSCVMWVEWKTILAMTVLTELDWFERESVESESFDVS